jgi:enoyl-CoA hydratase
VTVAHVETCTLGGGFELALISDISVAKRAEGWAAKVARMPADGLAIAKTAFSLVEETNRHVGEHATGFLIHAFATNPRFEEDEFNFVKERARLGTREAFRKRDEHFTVEDFE